MNVAEFRALRDHVCDELQRLEKFRRAYLYGYEISKKRSDLLNLLTIIFGALAGASGLLTVVAQDKTSSIITGCIGIVTAILAGLRQHYKWDERGDLFWEAYGAIERLQVELQNYITSVAFTGGRALNELFFQQNEAKIAAATKLAANNLGRFEAEAQAQYREHTIRRLTLEIAAVEAGPPEAVAPEVEADGIVPKQRG